MGAHAGSDGPTQRRAGTHRRTGQVLIERRDHTAQEPRRRFSLPAPSPSALVGIAVLVLIGAGVIHLSGSGSAVPLEAEPTALVHAEDGSGPEGASSAAAPASPSPEDAPPADGEAPAADGESPAAGAELVVHVSGAVATPGVVRLPAGARVDDALEAAGGPTEDADLSAVNLARPVGDGEQIHLPVPGEEPRAGDPGAAAPGDAETGEAPAAGSSGASGVINLNTASAAELEELPSVGPAIAQRIIEHREKNGPFRSVDGLLEVSGIGPSTLEKIRDRATI
ncbi:ComEA family DNA-binding protein [Brachybacterium paraconglomeratum]|uniref:ComEA family DNA-binding protein n=1 Tax=Brachybacterium paraconglomeratum TaxID=173362 RepID=UPI0031EB839F